VCVLPSVIQHAMRMCHIVICGLSGSAVFFPHYLIKGDVFRIATEHEVCFHDKFCLKYFLL